MSAIDKIAEVLEEIVAEANDEQAEKLRSLMAKYEGAYGRSLRLLKNIPGFAKLWDAMDSGTGMSMIRQMEAEADDGQPDEAQEWRDFDPHC
jgi:hypothetical protein